MTLNKNLRDATALHWIILDALEIAGQWNGKEPGVLEDRSHLATEIVEKAEELRELIEQLS